MMVWNKFEKLLDRKIKKGRRENILTASLICYTALQISDDAFLPVSFKNGTLTVTVPDSSSAANLQLSQAQIIKKINQKLGRELVKKIKIRIEN